MNRIDHSSTMQRIQATASEFEASARQLSGIQKNTNSIGTKIMEFINECYRSVEYFFSSERTEDKNELKSLKQQIADRTKKHDAEFAAHNKMRANLETTIENRGLLGRGWNLFSDRQNINKHNEISNSLNIELDQINKLKETAIKLNNYIMARSLGLVEERPDTAISG